MQTVVTDGALQRFVNSSTSMAVLDPAGNGEASRGRTTARTN